MNFTNSPFERMMRQRPGTDSDHPCISCRHRRECGYMMHQCRKKFRSVFGDTAPPVIIIPHWYSMICMVTVKNKERRNEISAG